MASEEKLKIYTLGHGNRPWESFIDILHLHHIGCVVDVRAMPKSARHPQYSQMVMAAELRRSGIKYIWQGIELGGFRKLLDDTQHPALRTRAMRAYASHMQTEAFRKGISSLVEQASCCPTAILCAEIQPSQCHRYLIADYLTHHGVETEHVVEQDQRLHHRISTEARADGAGLIYDRVGHERQLPLHMD